MIQKNTNLIPNDKTGVWTVRVFHLYRGFKRKVSYVGDFVKISVRKVKPNNWLLKKTKLNSVIIFTKKEVKKIDGTTLKFKFNACVLLKKRLTPKGKEIIGPVLFKVKRKRFMSSFSGTL